jgi:hypothetical protein
MAEAAGYQRTELLKNKTATGAGTVFSVPSNKPNRTFHANGLTTSGAGSATIKVQVSNDDDATWVDLGTITLTLSTTVSGDGLASSASWDHVRGNVTAISGTGASVSLYMGV